MDSKNAHQCTKNAGDGFSFDFLRVIPQRCQWISQSHRTSNRSWNVDFICECWIQRAVKAVDAHTLTKQAKKNLHKHCLPARKLMASVYSVWQEWSADGWIHVTRDHNNIRSVLRNTKKMCRASHSNNRRGMLTSGIHAVLLHDNACPHTAAPTRVLLQHFNWELFCHPP
jgi:hypothetical protein